jgi:hypothetical protein
MHYTLTDIERHFKLPQSPGHTVARNRLKALRPALERRGWLTTVPPNNALAVKQDGLALFSRLQQLIASGMTERAAAAKVLEEIGDKEAPPAIETGALREVIAELTRVLDGLAEVKMRCRESEAHIAELRATASSLADRIADIEARVSAIERPWWHRWRPALTERAQ